MGLFLCDICNEQLSLEDHICKQEDIRKRIQYLEIEAGTARHHLNLVQDAVFLILKSIGDESSLDLDLVAVETKLIRDLWKAAKCEWHDHKTEKSFLVMWMATHRVLCEAFSIFRKKSQGQIKPLNLLEKLTNLNKSCEEAKVTLGYESSKFDMTPEDLLKDYIT